MRQSSHIAISFVLAAGIANSSSSLPAGDLSLESTTRGLAEPNHAALFPEAFQEHMLVPNCVSTASAKAFFGLLRS
jgi:hypothetical protein